MSKYYKYTPYSSSDLVVPNATLSPHDQVTYFSQPPNLKWPFGLTIANRWSPLMMQLLCRLLTTTIISALFTMFTHNTMNYYFRNWSSDRIYMPCVLSYFMVSLLWVTVSLFYICRLATCIWDKILLISLYFHHFTLLDWLKRIKYTTLNVVLINPTWEHS